MQNPAYRMHVTDTTVNPNGHQMAVVVSNWCIVETFPAYNIPVPLTKGHSTFQCLECI